MKEPLIGIDLGTTNSAIAWVNNTGNPEVLLNSEGETTTPSVVQIRPDGSTLVGQAAKDELELEPESTAHFFKRDMGTNAIYDYHGHEFSPVELSAEVLKKLKKDAEATLSQPIRRAVITVPAYFHDGPRIATRKAAELAGLEVLQIINEPTAAALAYGLGRTNDNEVVLVYDLGGGTFDISLVSVTPEVIEVIGTDGDHELGGKDWDDRVVVYVAEEFSRRHGSDPMDDPYAFQELLLRAEEAKKALSARTRTTIAIQCAGKKDHIELTRELFQELTGDLVARTEVLIQSVLSRAKLDYSEISDVLFVGGSTRMPMCGQLVERLLGRPPRRTVNPDECVALGAAVQASLCIQPGRLRCAVKDVTSHSLGMLAVSPDGEQYINTLLIPRNETIPSHHTRPYQTSSQDSIVVYVTQGESEDPVHCSYVGKYKVSGFVPKGNEETTVLEISYAYDQSGVVKVSARQRSTGAALKVVKESIPDDMSWVSEPPATAPSRHKTVYLAVDLSGSMDGRPLRDAAAAMRAFVEQSDLTRTSIGLIVFADSVETLAVASQNGKGILESIASMQNARVGSGNSAHPFGEAFKLLGESALSQGLKRLLPFIKHEEPKTKLLVVLTDGCWCCEAKAIAAAKLCHAQDIEVVALGFGSVNEAFLKKIASADQAALLSDSSQLVSVFEQIAQVLVEDQSGSLTAGLRRR